MGCTPFLGAKRQIPTKLETQGEEKDKIFNRKIIAVSNTIFTLTRTQQNCHGDSSQNFLSDKKR